jgi:glycopeptide antibiotics resistance protein
MPRRAPRAPWWTYAVLVAYLAGLLVLVLWPEGSLLFRLQLQLGEWLWTVVPYSWMPFERLSFVLNALVAVPASALAMVLLPRSRWWHWALLAGVLSVGVELVQWRYLPERSPELSDVVANTLGAGAGALLGRRWRSGTHQRTGASDPMNSTDP